MSDADGRAPRLESPPRIDPEQAERRLVDSEHLARYLWARQVVLGSDVLDAGCGLGYGSRILAGAGAARVVGVDIDPDAIDRARTAARDQTEWLVGDITVLPFAADSFDVVVCFEVIEHLEQQTDALRELHRVLRPEGHLLISSPNRCQYPPGNPHHTHEFTIAEFTRFLQAHFTTVDLYCQQPWLGSLVEHRDRANADGDAAGKKVTYHNLASDPGPEEFILAVASMGSAVPVLESLSVLGPPFELRWWHDRLREAHRENAMLRASAQRAAQLEQRLTTLTRRLSELEGQNARIAQLERSLQECEGIVRSYESSMLGRLGRVLFHVRSMLR